ncbi:MAG: DEAD/DEAH box helicase [Treponema sp.]|jgi:ATP-dependent RNA helicase RhlB|nr:DEAD/DEAH box helicase [Treponema sp.]
MEFKELNLHPDLQRGIAEAGYVACMPVQEQVLANAFGGQDLYVQSQTGTGKTAAFLVVIYQRLLTEDLLAGKKAIIMVPTRELAVQVEEEAKVLGKYLPFKAGSFYGGVGYAQQLQMLRENVQILVGTPGRVLDLNKSGRMNLMDIGFLVLDEADRMFDMGFYPDLRKLIKVVPPADRRQTMLFSATLNAWVKNLAWEYTKNPYEIEIAPETVTVEEVDQLLYHVPSADKMRLLLGILEREKPESAVVFCNTKRYTEIVAKRLRMNGYECEFIIGDLPQARRLKVIDDVKAGKIRYLVATDVAARGLDIEGLAMVLNYDLPVESENYVHRIGRTARAGKTGKAITLASEQDVYELPDIEKYIGKKIPSFIAGEDLYAEDKSGGLRIRSEFSGSDSSGSRFPGSKSSGGGFFRKRDGSDRRQEGGRNDRGERNRHTGGRSRGNAASGDRRPAEHGGRDRGQIRQFEGADKGFAGGGPKPGAEAGDLTKLSFEERMTYYRQKYQGQAGGPEDSSPQTQTPPDPQTGRPQGKGRKDRNRRGGDRRKSPGTGGSRSGSTQGAAGHGGAGYGAALEGGASRQDIPGGALSGGGKPAEGRPRNDGGKTSGRKQGPRGNRGGMAAGSRGPGNGGRQDSGRTARQDRQNQEAAGREKPADKTAAGPRKGILGKLLSVFKREK